MAKKVAACQSEPNQLNILSFLSEKFNIFLSLVPFIHAVAKLQFSARNAIFWGGSAEGYLTRFVTGYWIV